LSLAGSRLTVSMAGMWSSTGLRLQTQRPRLGHAPPPRSPLRCFGGPLYSITETRSRSPRRGNAKAGRRTKARGFSRSRVRCRQTLGRSPAMSPAARRSPGAVPQPGQWFASASWRGRPQLGHSARPALLASWLSAGSSGSGDGGKPRGSGRTASGWGLQLTGASVLEPM
jgi:hypothetical protein